MALEFSQKLHLWFKLHTKFLHNNSLNIRHQRGNIFRCGISCIDHETAMLLRNLGTAYLICLLYTSDAADEL